MHDFSNALKLFYSILFADDTSGFLEGTEYFKLIKTVNYELALHGLTPINSLQISMRHIIIMMCHRSRIKHTRCDITMQGKTVQYVSTTKFFRVIVDNKLKWNNYIIYTKNKIGK